MKKIVFISDFFVNEINGGAEICDDILISELESKGYKVCKFKSQEFTSKHILLYGKMGFKFIVSNFLGVPENCRKYLQLGQYEYFIMEHDHKYLVNRNPALFTNFKAPPQEIVNRDFYASAKFVFCQSSKHKEVLELNLGIDNVVNLGCSLWSKEQLDFIRSNITTKNNKSFISGDRNPIKGLPEAIKHCTSKGLEYDILPRTSYESFIAELAKYERFVFFPKTLETFCRVILEARMLGCKLATNTLNGCTYEPWFKQYKGEELINFVDSQRDLVVSKIVECLNQERNQDQKEGDITVILNCYRRPYNLEMQIAALRNQTVKPAQIWLWINHHEDNENFDPSGLDVDRVFKNDFNWKFYGRFAASLLADTEYVAIYDDDTIPGSKWHENCLNTMKTHEGILGSAGIILKGNRYVQHDRCGWPTQNPEVTEVDLVGHAWFFKREWLRYLWQEKPTTWDNGEDIQFAFMAKIHGGIPTYCPPHPPSDKEMHGSILGNELGIDSKATSTNSAVSHQQFFSERDLCVQTGLSKGWKTVKDISL
jgi:hypothetical protein|tara:strand:- start:2384 stop:4000 length:1617 start_codon:yes stop_codon:yes gene_type:complete